MKKIKIYLLFIIILLIFLPIIKTDSEEQSFYTAQINEEKLYKVTFNNFFINEIDKINNMLKIREIELEPINNIEYIYNVKSTDENLSEELLSSYYEYMNNLNMAEYLLKNNFIKIKSIKVLNTYDEINKVLKKNKYKISIA